jgi:2C-methyl-D-erythritol 2,4-cyclodiphosphate synthase
MRVGDSGSCGAQKPKLSPFKEQIRENVCALLEAHPSAINIKAKTHEKVGWGGGGS